MAEFKISKIRYTWKGGWVTGTAYNRDDVVRFGGSTYSCIRQHTATSFKDDLDYIAPGDTNSSPAWSKMTDGIAFVGTWRGSPSTLYNVGDVVNYAGSLYICLNVHNSSTLFETNQADWATYVASLGFDQQWQEQYRYAVGQLVSYGGNIYKCRVGHTSSNASLGLENDGVYNAISNPLGKWDIAHEGAVFVGDYTAGVRYKINDLVLYYGSLIKCTTGHTSLPAFNELYWSVDAYGQAFGGEYNPSIYYGIGSVVKYGGFIYYSLSNNFAKIPGDAAIASTDWELLARGINLRGDWSSSTTYKTGDVVRRGGHIYIAKLDTQNDGSTLDYLDASNWELVVPSLRWRNFWQSGTIYQLGDVVTYIGTAYRCNQEHTSAIDNYPGDNGSGFFYWDVLLLSGPNVGLRSRGDLLTYDLSRGSAGDGSTFGATAVPIGQFKQLLTVKDDDSLFYSGWGDTTAQRFVSPTGLDDPTYGNNPFKPWKTIKYACQQIEKLNNNDLVTVRIETGVYEEILPIVVPKKTALVGGGSGFSHSGDLRSVTVKPNSVRTNLANEFTQLDSCFLRLGAIIDNIVLGEIITKTPGNTATQINTSPSISAYAIIATNLVSNMQTYLNFVVNGVGASPTLTGTNTATTVPEAILAINIIEANKTFIVSELYAHLLALFPTTTLPADEIHRDLYEVIEALKYDIRYPGNYKSIRISDHFANFLKGSQNKDMFYVRDTTGIRNMTLSGLSGTLAPAGQFILTQRPTGKSFVSLDPGWGPSDQNVWIINRSPYIQNVTNIGTGSVGLKIDGLLHNGGNKSVVANDFTQVIDDGIGVWVSNQGRSELVSVFTYYAHIGYLTENGGIIRATNGNNSYGNYGSVASGNDNLETPQFAILNNQTEEAQISAGFAGESNDELLALEFANAGQRYTSANYNIIGSGVGASILQEEFRDNAVFDVRIKRPSGQPLANPGGGGYTLFGNNAQIGDNFTITIANSDTNEESQLLGLRLIITSGTGTGQYGYIYSYNSLTKIAVIYKESDNTPGWDHIVPGTPILNVLDTTTFYRVEPRPVFEDPGFSATQRSIGVTYTPMNVVYGETTVTFNNVQCALGTGTVIAPTTKSAATFNVVKNGRSYAVTLAQGGAGYAVGEVVKILGTSLGGVEPDNAIFVTVTGVSGGATNAITSFTYRGTGISGRFIITGSATGTARTSRNGETWASATLPSNGDWKALAAGNNKFVAIRKSSNAAASSLDGVTWTARTMPSSSDWNSCAYGSGIFVAVSELNNSGAYSSNDGTNWTASTLPGGATVYPWIDIAYGRNIFVAISSDKQSAVGTYNGGVLSWVLNTITADTVTMASIAYGNSKFLAITTTGDTYYSFDGVTWYTGADLPKPDGSTVMGWKSIRYGQGVFFATCDTNSAIVGADATTGPIPYGATSDNDGLSWTGRTLASTLSWGTSAFGNPDIIDKDSTLGNRTGVWVVIPDELSLNINQVFTGQRAKGRCLVESGRITQIKLWNPGSGYLVDPSVTVIDPNNTSDVSVECRRSDGVLGQPTFLNKGTGYRTSSTRVTVTGDGFADIIPLGKNIFLDNVTVVPGPGAQLRFGDRNDVYTVQAINSESLLDNGKFRVGLRITPTLTVDDNLQHETDVEIREKYSQIRLTGHDFLDIGTGNFVETNYPTLYSGFFFSAPENETEEVNGGRVFFTSTDQDGNFRVGELFAVEQATGIVTVSADFFDLQGLTELRLGGVRVGSGTVIREFSTDALFTADSNNVVPTQRAIKAYLTSRLSVGGASVSTPSIIAGQIKIGPNIIDTTVPTAIEIPVLVDFSGPNIGISGTLLANTFFKYAFR